MRDGVTREVDGEERHVHEPVEVRLPGRDNRFRLLRDEKAHDREIVGCEVPHDAHVVLEEPQVDPRRVVVVEVTQHPLVDELTDLPHRAREQEGVVDHDPETLPLGQLDQLLGLSRGGGERLLHEDVLAVLQGGLRQVEVCADGRHHRDRVDVRRREQVGGLRGDGQVWVRLPDALEGLGVLVADARHVAAFEAAQVADDVRTPIAVANDADSNHGVFTRKLRNVPGRSRTG